MFHLEEGLALLQDVAASHDAPHARVARNVAQTSITEEPFKPSTGTQIEGGIKYNGAGLPDNIRVFATAALFDVVDFHPVDTGRGYRFQSLTLQRRNGD